MIKYYRILVQNKETQESHRAYIKDTSLRRAIKRAAAFMVKCANITEINPLQTDDGAEVARYGWTFAVMEVSKDEFDEKW